ncbi:hypothetical protein ONZ45_g9269 [Pleurotus djamor]|nr:hypothetical protein ONZ45_g9269 [Pleurotus djamor]
MNSSTTHPHPLPSPSSVFNRPARFRIRIRNRSAITSSPIPHPMVRQDFQENLQRRLCYWREDFARIASWSLNREGLKGGILGLRVEDGMGRKEGRKTRRERRGRERERNGRRRVEWIGGMGWDGMQGDIESAASPSSATTTTINHRHHRLYTISLDLARTGRIATNDTALCPAVDWIHSKEESIKEPARRKATRGCPGMKPNEPSNKGAAVSWIQKDAGNGYGHGQPNVDHTKQGELAGKQLEDEGSPSIVVRGSLGWNQTNPRDRPEYGEVGRDIASKPCVAGWLADASSSR